jgi:GNAT superfamily N-acetyltransferase
MTMREKPDDGGLDALFAEARREGPPAGLVARVLAEAEAARPGRRREGLGAALLRAIGGWPSAAGLAAASAAGLLIGFAAPEAVPFLSAGATVAADAGYELIDLAPGYGVLAAFEG